MSKRWKKRPKGSNWGEFGDDDQVGRINLLTPESVKAAAAEVREGLRFCLSLPLDYPGGNVLNPRRFPPVLSPTEFNGEKWMNYPMGKLIQGATDVVSDDQVLLTLQYSTQWDSLAHVGSHFDADGDGVAEKVITYNVKNALDAWRKLYHHQLPEIEHRKQILTNEFNKLGSAHKVDMRSKMHDIPRVQRGHQSVQTQDCDTAASL